MKAEDLMIGDLVKVSMNQGAEVEYGRVSNLDESGGIEVGVIGEHSTYFNLEGDDEILPIPLTKEILLKNGFEDFSGGGCIIKELDDNEIPTLYIWDGNNSIYVVDYYSTNKYTYIKECKYVHEFQHELKSCGIEKKIIL